MAEVLLYVLPELLIVALASLAYVLATWLGAWRGWRWYALGTLTAAALCLIVLAKPGSDPTIEAAYRNVAFDHWGYVCRWLTVASGIAVVLMSWERRERETAGEFYGSLLLLTAGLGFVAVANDLILLFAALELISIPTYVLLYMSRQELQSREAAAKYFYLSVLGSALFLFGAALAYGLAGTTNLTAMHDVLGGPRRQMAAPPELGALAAGLIIAGLGFKLAAVPFHFYAADVYEGTTNVMAAVMSWFPKAAGILAAVRLLPYALIPLDQISAWLIWVFAAATMTVGNTMALLQTNVRRLMAYSGIAHAGYMLVALGAACMRTSEGALFDGVNAVLLYLLAYLMMVMGFFALLVLLGDAGYRLETIEDFAGLAERAPLPAALAAVLLISFIGLPFTLGFWAKLAVFYSAVATSEARYITLAAIGLVNAAIGAYYYLRLVAYMYLRRAYHDVRYEPRHPALVVLVVCTLLTLWWGLWPRPAVSWTRPTLGETRPATATLPPAHKGHSASVAVNAANRG